MVPGAGLEPARCYQRGILNPYEQASKHTGLIGTVPNKIHCLSV